MLLYHVFCDAFPFDPWAGRYLPTFLPFNGVMAIFIFFLVSGFSLSNDYLARGDLLSWIRTTVGRYLRLAIPIFFACAVVHVAMLWGWIDPPSERLPKFQAALTFTPTIDHLLYFSFYGSFFDFRNTFIFPLWTMRFELIGSYVALVAVLVFRNAPYRPLIFLCLGAMIFIFAPDPDYTLIALFPIGCALADCYQRGWIDAVPAHVATVLIFVAIAIPFLVNSETDLVWRKVGATLLIVGCIALPAVRRFLEGPTSVWLGEICFPLYLIHGPIIWIVGEPLTRNFGVNMTSRILIDILTVAVSIVAAVAFSPANRLAISISRGMFTNPAHAGQSIR